MLDSMLTIDPSARATLDDLLASTWLSPAASAVVALDHLAATRLARLRAPLRWARLRRPARLVGRLAATLRRLHHKAAIRRAAATSIDADDDCSAQAGCCGALLVRLMLHESPAYEQHEAELGPKHAAKHAPVAGDGPGCASPETVMEALRP
eukprot:2186962-Prymnesium_polylepis.1